MAALVTYTYIYIYIYIYVYMPLSCRGCAVGIVWFIGFEFASSSIADPHVSA